MCHIICHRMRQSLNSLIQSVSRIVGKRENQVYLKVLKSVQLLHLFSWLQNSPYLLILEVLQYAPLVLLIVLYYKIYKAARKRIRKRSKSAAAGSLSTRQDESLLKVKPDLRRSEPSINELNSTNSNSDDAISTKFNPATSVVAKTSLSSCCNGETPDALNLKIPLTSKGSQLQMMELSPQPTSKSPLTKLRKVTAAKPKKDSAEMRRERRAFTTLAIVTGTFVVCWLPFFILALIRPICSCEWANEIDSVFLWLGYVNSLMNPVIYTIFSPDFRAAFRRLCNRLCGL